MSAIPNTITVTLAPTPDLVTLKDALKTADSTQKNRIIKEIEEVINEVRNG